MAAGPHQVPAGVIVYNGDSGELELFRTVEPGALPGAVYPLSLAPR